MPTGVKQPPPAPCSTRKSTNWLSDWAMPHRADAETKMARAKRKTRLYPKRSPNQPDAGMKTARLTRYPTITPSIEAELTWNWRASVGNATLTTVESMEFINIAQM